MSNKYLLEIGVEELPARLVGSALTQLESNMVNLLKEERISYDKIEVFATPRRLTIIVDGIDEKQEDLKERVKGPSEKISFDENKQATKALLGFLRGKGASLEDVEVEDEYIYVNTVKKGLSIEEIIKNNIPNVIKNISFPKSMRWGGKNLKFARPIRWIISLLNDKIIEFDLEGIKVSNVTRGHRFLGSDHIVIENIDDYEKSLRDNYVILDQKERKDTIRYGAEKLAAERGGSLDKDEALLDEVTNIVEYPTPIIGRIKDDYLKLPQEILITPMKEHQRYFPVLDDKGRLLPYFVTVRNGNEEHADLVIKGNEKVLGARLEDAKFFYDEDLERSLDSYVENLKNVTFQEKLGTLYEKTVRLEELSEKISSALEVGEETTKNAVRASYLAKADLVTKMVGEFSELQGKMGMLYAEKSGENEIVSLAIYEQYLPRFAGDSLPTTTAGLILSIAEKLDNICGLFAVGIQPTGSQDPFGLRRQALGIINIILDKKLDLNLTDLIENSLYIYVDKNGLAFDYEKVKKEIVAFFNRRIRNMFIDAGVRYDIVDAVVGEEVDDIYDMKIRAIKLNSWLEEKLDSDILAAFNRLSNLAEKSESDLVARDLLEEAEEIALYDAFVSIEDEVKTFIDKKDYDKALDQLTSLKEPIDKFFEKVMVMVEDENIKNNRLGLLRKIYNTMIEICDLSKIVSK